MSSLNGRWKDVHAVHHQELADDTVDVTKENVISVQLTVRPDRFSYMKTNLSGSQATSRTFESTATADMLNS
jgi:hypothetical protein